MGLSPHEISQTYFRTKPCAKGAAQTFDFQRLAPETLLHVPAVFHGAMPVRGTTSEF